MGIGRSKLGMLSLMTGMMAMGMGMGSGPGVETRTRVSRKYEPYKPQPLPNNIMGTEVHKGHKIEMVKFTIETPHFIANITLPVSGGSPKSIGKKRILMGNELKTYVAKNTKEDLIKFGQFEITPIEPKITPKANLKQFLDKGDYQGICNRTACETKLAAVYFNHSTKKHYCQVCADMINKVNPESYEMYGHELCTLVNPEKPLV